MLPLPHVKKQDAAPGVLRISVADGPFKKLNDDLVREFETTYLVDALRRSNGNIAHAAAASGKPRRVFFELMRKHGLKAPECLGEEAAGLRSVDLPAKEGRGGPSQGL